MSTLNVGSTLGKRIAANRSPTAATRRACSGRAETGVGGQAASAPAGGGRGAAGRSSKSTIRSRSSRAGAAEELPAPRMSKVALREVEAVEGRSAPSAPTRFSSSWRSARRSRSRSRARRKGRRCALTRPRLVERREPRSVRRESTIIVGRFGTSIPTSTTVVATRTSSQAKRRSASPFLPAGVARGGARSGARRAGPAPRSVCHGRRGTRRIVVVVIVAAPDARADHERLLARGHPLAGATATPWAGPPARAPRCGWAAVRRVLVDDRDVEVAVDG